MKNILIIVDKGDVWEITGQTVQTDEYEVDPLMVREMPIDPAGLAMWNYIKARLPLAQLQYAKDLEGNLIVEDLIEVEYDIEQLYREQTIHKGREYLTTRLGIHSIFEFFDFIMLNNTLSAAGFIVTNQNRREKYLEVIDTGDIDLIDTLELYLNALDKMAIINGWYKTYKEFEKNIYLTETNTECDELWKVFVQIFE
jgi:hypothetical protein